MSQLHRRTAASRALRDSSGNWREKGGCCWRRGIGDKGAHCNVGTIQWAIHWTSTEARVVHLPMMRIIICGSMLFLQDTLLIVSRRDHHFLVKPSLPFLLNSCNLICYLTFFPYKNISFVYFIFVLFSFLDSNLKLFEV